MEPNVNNKISYRCTYDVKGFNEVQIINDRNKTIINGEIAAKIKILNGNQIKNLILKKNLINLD